MDLNTVPGLNCRHGYPNRFVYLHRDSNYFSIYLNQSMRRSNIVNPVATVIPIITKFDLSFFFGLGRDSDIIVYLPSFHLFVDVIHSQGV